MFLSIAFQFEYSIETGLSTVEIEIFELFYPFIPFDTFKVNIGSADSQSKLLEDITISVAINLRILRLCLMILPRLLVGNFSSIIQL